VLRPGEPVGFRTSTGASRGSYSGDFEATLADLIGRLDAGSTLAELGAGANPLLARHPRVASGELDYIVVDIAQGELDKAPKVGRVLCCDVAGPAFPLVDEVDLAFSTMLAEHVHDAPHFLRNVAQMLKLGGMYLQVSPVLYTVPFLINRIIPDRVSSVLLDVFQPRDREIHDKFPALYDLCRGPSARHIRRIESVGLRVLAARGYFGHNYYARLPVLRSLEVRKSGLLARHPIPQLCSFAVYLLARNDSEPAASTSASEQPTGAATRDGG
jgi:SAM-dependent methyltransferase